MGWLGGCGNPFVGGNSVPPTVGSSLWGSRRLFVAFINLFRSLAHSVQLLRLKCSSCRRRTFILVYAICTVVSSSTRAGELPVMFMQINTLCVGLIRYRSSRHAHTLLYIHGLEGAKVGAVKWDKHLKISINFYVPLSVCVFSTPQEQKKRLKMGRTKRN